MILTHDQEQALLTKYSSTISAIAWSYYARYCGNRRVEFDDVLQECLLVFLKHIRRIDSMDHLQPLPYRDFLHAVCAQIMAGLPASVPKRTTDFRRIMQTVGDGGSLDALMEDNFDIADPVAAGYSDVIELASLEKFLSEISEEDTELIMAMKSAGGSMTIAAERLGVNRSTISRKLAPLRKKYLRDCKKMGGNVA